MKSIHQILSDKSIDDLIKLSIESENIPYSEEVISLCKDHKLSSDGQIHIMVISLRHLILTEITNRYINGEL